MLPDINLLPKYEKERSLLYILFVIGLILALCLTGFLVYQYITIKDELDHVTAHNSELLQEKEALEWATSTQEPTETESLEEAVVYAEKYVVPTSKLIDQLMTFLPATGYLSKYHYQQGNVEIDSHFETMTDASSYMAKLDASDFTKNARVNRIETFELEPPATDTEIGETMEISPFELLPRYQVTYSFEVHSAQLQRENKENE